MSLTAARARLYRALREAEPDEHEIPLGRPVAESDDDAVVVARDLLQRTLDFE